MSTNQPGERFDDDKIGGDYPPDRPLGANEFGTTPAEQAVGEPLAERVAREEPDVLVPEDEPIELVAPDEGARPDTEGAEVATAALDGLGPLSDDDPLAGDPSLRDVATEHEGAIPAEEAAVHIVDEPGP